MHGLKYQKITDFDDQRALDLIKSLRQKSYDDDTILKLLNNQDEMTARGPMQWDDSQYHGFSNHEPWNWAQTDTNSVDQEIINNDSIMTFYQKLMRLKKQKCFTSGNYKLLITDPNIYAYLRKTTESMGLVIANFSDKKKTFELPKAAWKSVLTNEKIKRTGGTVELGPWGCCALESRK